MAGNPPPAVNLLEIPFDKSKHVAVQKGGLVADKDGVLGYPVYDMPKDIMFDRLALSNLPANIQQDLKAQNLGGQDGNRQDKSA